jgi:hypothetical protein
MHSEDTTRGHPGEASCGIPAGGADHSVSRTGVNVGNLARRYLRQAARDTAAQRSPRLTLHLARIVRPPLAEVAPVIV